MTKDAKDKSAEALSRLEMLLSLGWVVTISRPLDFEDYNVVIMNALATECVSAYDADLATAITKAINIAAKGDPTFRDFEKALAD